MSTSTESREAVTPFAYLNPNWSPGHAAGGHDMPQMILAADRHEDWQRSIYTTALYAAAGPRP